MKENNKIISLKKESSVCWNIVFECISIIAVLFLACILAYNIGIDRENIIADEFITMQDSSSFAPNRINWQHPEDYLNVKYNGSEYRDSLVNGVNNSFFTFPKVKLPEWFVVNNQYHCLLTFIKLFIHEGGLIWEALWFNILLYCCSLLVVYKIIKKTYGKVGYAVLTMLVIAFSQGSNQTVGYVRFYQFQILCILLIIYNYQLAFSYIDNPKRQLRYLIFSLILTWIGYCNAPYTVFVAGLALVVYVISCSIERKWKVVVEWGLGYLLLLGAAWMYLREAVLYHMREKKTSGYHASQFAVLFDNLQNRSIDEFKVFLNEYIRMAVLYSWPYKLFWICILGCIGYRLYHHFIKKGKIDKKRVFLESMLAVICIGYLLTLSKVAPWMAWRYAVPFYYCIPLLLCGLLINAQNNKWVCYVFLSIVLLWQAKNYLVWGHNAAVNVLNADGPGIKQQKELENKLGKYDSIYFYSGDVGDLYYGGFLWPDDTSVYLTSLETFDIDNAELQEILSNDQILIWVRSEEAWNDIELVVEQLGYSDNYMFEDTGEKARQIIYLCSKE